MSKPLKESIQEIRDEIAKGRMDEAIMALASLLETTQAEAYVIDFNHFCFRINELLRKERNGLLEAEQLRIEQNQITWGLLSFLTHLEKTQNGRLQQNGSFLEETRFENEKKLFLTYAQLIANADNTQSTATIAYLEEKLQRLHKLYQVILSAVGIGSILGYFRLRKHLNKFVRWEEQMKAVQEDLPQLDTQIHFYFIHNDTLGGTMEVETFVKNVLFPSEETGTVLDSTKTDAETKAEVWEELKDLWQQ
ncbi:MAG: hypothetical protein AAGD05_08065 [Bacteroidota bacterium]